MNSEASSKNNPKSTESRSQTKSQPRSACNHAHSRPANRVDASFLVNFHHSDRPGRELLTANHQTSRSSPTKPKKLTAKQEEDRRLERRARQQHASAFYLRSSAQHAFVVNRQVLQELLRKNSKVDLADLIVPWGAIEIVQLLVEEDASQTSKPSIVTCPVCLGDFIAPRIVPCGHVFCLACFLHHWYTANTQDHAPIKCPCCSVQITSLNEVRPVIFRSVLKPQINSTMTFQKLLTLKKGVVIDDDCAPVFQGSKPVRIPNFSSPTSKFYRFTLQDEAPTALQNLLEHELQLISLELRELAQHKALLPTNAMKDALDVECSFWYMAQEMVKSQLTVVADVVAKAPKQANNDFLALKDDLPIKNSSSLRDSGHLWTDDDTMADEFKDAKPPSPDSRQATSNLVKPLDSSSIESSYQAFYQSTDGQLCFLSGFNMACLRHEIHNELCCTLPETLQGHVVDIETVTLTQDVRTHRLTFLHHHVPLYAQVQLIELNLLHPKCPYLSDETKAHFKPEYDRRKRKRQQRKQLEKKATLEIERKLASLQVSSPTLKPQSERSVPAMPLTEEFGPSLSSTPTKQPQFSQTLVAYNQVAASHGYFPDLAASMSPPARSNSRPWGTPSKASPTTPTSTLQTSTTPAKKTKGRPKKVTLFSTGGNRAAG